MNLSPREVTGHCEEGGDGDVQVPFSWDNFVAEFYNIFDPPGMPMERDIVHQIQPFPNAESH